MCHIIRCFGVTPHAPIFRQVVGATGSTIVTYVLPGACYYITFSNRPSRCIAAPWLPARHARHALLLTERMLIAVRPSRYIGLAMLLTGALFICPVSLYLIFNK
jgi:hypothetical protein